jgi:septum formation protein
MLNINELPIDLPELILASGSPRRAEILTSVGWPFKKIVPSIDESELPGENPEEYVKRLAKEKAEAISIDHPSETILGADTTVVIDKQIIGKPKDKEDARRMISLLSGNWHEVLTGVAIVRNGSTSVGIQKTRVKFSDMTDREIKYLVECGDPLDKAGGYAVQAQAALFIEGIEGDYWNVVGLPINLVYSLVGKYRAQ